MVPAADTQETINSLTGITLRQFSSSGYDQWVVGRPEFRQYLSTALRAFTRSRGKQHCTAIREREGEYQGTTGLEAEAQREAGMTMVTGTRLLRS
jgi:hypothetical protein